MIDSTNADFADMTQNDLPIKSQIARMQIDSTVSI